MRGILEGNGRLGLSIKTEMASILMDLFCKSKKELHDRGRFR